MSENSNSQTAAPAGGLPLLQAGWYPDPVNSAAQRYWDGIAWVGEPLAAQATPADQPAAQTAPPTRKRLRWWQWALIVVGALVLIGIINGAINGARGSGASAGSADDSAPKPSAMAEETVETVEVPDLVGLTMAEARVALDAVDLVLVTGDAGDDWIVTAQQPAAGEHPLEGLELSVISEAPKPVYTLEQQNALDAARSYLDLMGFSRQGLIGQLSSEYGSAYRSTSRRGPPTRSARTGTPKPWNRPSRTSS